MPRLLILTILLLAPVLRAHQIAEMTMRIEGERQRFRALVQADAAYMLPEYRGDEDVAAQDLAWLRGLDETEWARIRQESENFLRQSLVIRSDSTTLDWQITFPDFDQTPPGFMIEGIAEMPPMITLEIDGDFEGETLSLRWDETFGVVLIVQSGGETIPIVSGYEEAVLHRDAGGVVETVEPSFLGWILLGFRHIIPDGFDHVCFILGIFLLQPRWKPLVALSLIFTLAHSLTLGLAALGWVQLPERWVEVAIAASIAWVGIENLWAKDASRGRYGLIAFFGLIHGLGFARMLTPLLPADRPDALLFGIAGFNVGVELGQLLVLALAFAIFGWWKDEAFAKVRTIGSVMVALVGLTMFASQLLEGWAAWSE